MVIEHLKEIAQHLEEDTIVYCGKIIQCGKEKKMYLKRDGLYAEENGILKEYKRWQDDKAD